MLKDVKQVNRTVRYQFWLNEQPAAPPRDDWEDAAKDVIAAGHGGWLNPHEMVLDPAAGAEIRRIYNEALPVPPVN